MEVEKLIDMGEICEKLDFGAFTGLSEMDVAIEYGNEGVVGLLHRGRTTASTRGHRQ